MRPEQAPGGGRLYFPGSPGSGKRKIKDLNFVGFDLVEVLPAYDHGEITAYLA